MEQILALIIEANGWGSSGYYSEEVLKRDGPSAFPKGTLMFWNHATKQELRERPEGNMSTLAAVFISDPIYDPNGKDGPGLYVWTKAFSDYVTQIKEKGPYTGLSIFAEGTREWGEVNGKKGYIITSIKPSRMNSVDIVTRAGRNGRFLIESRQTSDRNGRFLIESRQTSDESTLLKENIFMRGKRQMPNDDLQEVRSQLKEAQATITQLQGENVHLQTENNHLRAQMLIEGIMHEDYGELSSAAKRLISKVIRESLPVLADGTLDQDGVRKRIAKEARPFLREGIERQIAPLPSTRGQPRVYGHGSTSAFSDFFAEATKAREYLTGYLEG